MTPIDPIRVILAAPPGSVSHARMKDNAASWGTAFCIKEERATLEPLPRNPVVEVRAGLVEDAGVLAVPLLIRLSGKVYESWLNYRAHGDKRACLDLALQDSIPIYLFVSADRPDRSISLRNRLKTHFSTVITRAGELAPWTSEAFENTHRKVSSRCPTVHLLWEALGDTPFQQRAQ